MRTWICAVLFVLGLGVSTARAADNKAAAKEAFRDGTRQYELGDYRQALDAFKRAYLNYEEPAFLFNIAQCYRQIGEKQEALRFYKLFLRKVPDAPNHEEVQNVVANLQAAIEQERTARNQPPSGTIGPEAPREPRPTVPAPETTASTPATNAGGSTLEVERSASRPAHTPVYKKWWLWSAVGVVVVGAALGIGLGVGLSNQQPGSHFGAVPVF